MQPEHEVDDLRCALKLADDDFKGLAVLFAAVKKNRDTFQAENRRLSAYVADLEATIATLMQMNLQNEAAISQLRDANNELTDRLEASERLSENRNQCRNDAWAMMARDSVP